MCNTVFENKVILRPEVNLLNIYNLFPTIIPQKQGGS